MLRLLETLKDSAEATFDSATTHVENTHRLVGGYVATQAHRLTGLSTQEATSEAQRSSIYDVIRGVNREIGGFGTDIFDIIDDARARRRAERDR